MGYRQVIYGIVICIGAAFLLLVIAIIVSEINVSDESNERMLVQALLRGDVPKVKDIVNEKVDLESKNTLSDPMLHIALRYGYVPRSSNFKVEKSPVERERIIYDMVSILLKNGAKINSIDQHQYTPLVMAVRRGNIYKVVELLLENGAEVNLKCKSGDTALHIAVRLQSKLETIKLLLVKGANVNIKNDTGQTAIDIAKEQGNHEIIELLSKYTAMA